VVDWIYSGSAATAAPVCESYLLGKKSVFVSEVQKEPIEDKHHGLFGSKNLPLRDAEAKAREDPLFLIKQNEKRRNNQGKPTALGKNRSFR
jgi:hypothetical protein